MQDRCQAHDQIEQRRLELAAWGTLAQLLLAAGRKPGFRYIDLSREKSPAHRRRRRRLRKSGRSAFRKLVIVPGIGITRMRRWRHSSSSALHLNGLVVRRAIWMHVAAGNNDEWRKTLPVAARRKPRATHTSSDKPRSWPSGRHRVR
jgi:hypothetical protein